MGTEIYKADDTLVLYADCIKEEQYDSLYISYDYYNFRSLLFAFT